MDQQKKLVLLSIFPNAPKSLVFDRVQLLDAPRDPTRVQLIAKALKTTKDKIVSRGSEVKQAVVRGLSRFFLRNQVPYGESAEDILENQDADDRTDIAQEKETVFDPLEMCRYPNELLLAPVFGGKDFEVFRETDEIADLTTLLGSRSPERKIDAGGCYVEYKNTDDQSCEVLEEERLSALEAKSAASGWQVKKLTSSTVSYMFTPPSVSAEAAPNRQRPNTHACEKRTNGGMSVVCCAGYVYVIGVIMDKASTDGVIRTKVTEKGDERTIVWQKVVDLPLKCPFHASTASKDEIFITGGRSKNNVDHQVLRTFLTHRPKSGGNWRVFNGIPLPREHHALVYLNGKLYLIGGKDEFDGSKDVYICQVHSKPNQWTESTPMHKQRFSFVTAVHESHIYVAGGYPRRDPGIVSAERFDTKVEMWEELRGYSASDNPIIGFTFGDWICIIGGRPICLNVSTMKEDSRLTWNLTGVFRSSPRITRITERLWEEPMRFELPLLNLNCRSAVVTTMMCRKQS